MDNILKEMQKAEERLHDSTKETAKPKFNLLEAEKHEKNAISGLAAIIKKLTEKKSKS